MSASRANKEVASASGSIGSQNVNQNSTRNLTEESSLAVPLVTPLRKGVELAMHSLVRLNSRPPELWPRPGNALSLGKALSNCWPNRWMVRDLLADLEKGKQVHDFTARTRSFLLRTFLD